MVIKIHNIKQLNFHETFKCTINPNYLSRV
jgi:hypothetical protein